MNKKKHLWGTSTVPRPHFYGSKNQKFSLRGQLWSFRIFFSVFLAESFGSTSVRAPRTIVRLCSRPGPFLFFKITCSGCRHLYFFEIENGKNFFEIFKRNLEIFFCFIQDRQDEIQQLQSWSSSYIWQRCDYQFLYSTATLNQSLVRFIKLVSTPLRPL